MTYNPLKTKEIKQAFIWLSEYWDKPTHPNISMPEVLRKLFLLPKNTAKKAGYWPGLPMLWD